MPLSQAITAISSRSTSAVIQSMLAELAVPCTEFDTGSALLNHFDTEHRQGILFISLEVLKEIDSNPSAALESIRHHFFGAVYVLSINPNRTEFRNLIEHGATDIIDIGDVSIIKGILNTYSLFQQLGTDGKGLVALVVEDSPAQQKVLCSILESKKVQPLVVPTVREALLALKFEDIDIVISDIHLVGDLTGMHLLRELCQSTVWQGIPVFVISGVVPEMGIKEYFQLGVRDFMTKPLDVDFFSIRLDNIIRERMTFLELQEEKGKLREIAYTDSLTKINNRAYLKKHYQGWAATHNDQFYALMLDMDNLKTINDQVGHDAGDTAIMAVSAMISNATADEEICIRLGGDEFIALWQESDENAIKFRVRDLLYDLNNKELSGNIRLEASIGVVHISSRVDLSQVLKRCDALMYLAKDSGKNAVEYEF